MLGPWEGSKTEGKLGFPQAEKGPLGKTDVSADQNAHEFVHHPGFLPGAVTVATLRGHFGLSLELNGELGGSLGKVLEGTVAWESEKLSWDPFLLVAE